MMLKQKSNPWARLKYLYVLPLTAVAVVAFANQEISTDGEKTLKGKVNKIIVLNKSGDTQVQDSLVSNKNGKIVITSSTTESGGNKMSVQYSSSRTDTTQSNTNVMTIRIDKSGSDNAVVKPGLIIIDGVEQPADFSFSDIDAGDIESMQVLKNAYATAIYGEKGKDGVIILKTKKKNQ